MKYDGEWYKDDPESKVWWLDIDGDVIGVFIFSFDREHTFNLFSDYPYKLSKDQLAIFNKENPFWRKFFSDRFE